MLVCSRVIDYFSIRELFVFTRGFAGGWLRKKWEMYAQIEFDVILSEFLNDNKHIFSFNLGNDPGPIVIFGI